MIKQNRPDDLRTRYGRETEVLKQVAKSKGFSVFWASESRARSSAIARLIYRGDIVSTGPGAYPWCPYRIAKMKVPSPRP